MTQLKFLAAENITTYIYVYHYILFLLSSVFTLNSSVCLYFLESSIANFDSYGYFHMIYKYLWTPLESESVLLIHQSEKVDLATNVSEIFDFSCDDPRCILIEGAAGIGKSLLGKEIAYKWACNDLLSSDKLLLLLQFHDPYVVKVQFIHDLAHYIFGKGTADKDAKCLFDCDGRNITIVLDGYSKVFDLVERSLITRLLDRKVMPQCTIIVISSTTLVELYGSANIRVQVLGYIENNNDDVLSKPTYHLNKLLKVTLNFKAKSYLHEFYCIPQIYINLVHLANELCYVQYRKFVCSIFEFLNQPHRSTDNFSLSVKRFECYFNITLLSLWCNDKSTSLVNSHCQRLVVDTNMFSLLKSVKYFGREESDNCACYVVLHTYASEYLAAYSSSAIVSPQSDFLNICFFLYCWRAKFESSCIEQLHYRCSLYKCTCLWNIAFITLLLTDIFLRSGGLYAVNYKCDNDVMGTILDKVRNFHSLSEFHVWNCDIKYVILSHQSRNNTGNFTSLSDIVLPQKAICIGKFCKALQNAAFGKLLCMLFVNLANLEIEKLQCNHLLHYTLVYETGSPLSKLHYNACKHASRIIINAALKHNIKAGEALSVQSKKLSQQFLDKPSMFEGNLMVNDSIKVFNVSIINTTKETLAYHVSNVNRLCLRTFMFHDTITIKSIYNEFLHPLTYAMMDVQVDHAVREMAASLKNVAEQNTKLHDVCLDQSNLCFNFIKILATIQQVSCLKLCNRNMIEKMSEHFLAVINIINFLEIEFLDKIISQLSAVDVSIATALIDNFILWELDTRSEWVKWINSTETITSNHHWITSSGVINSNLQSDYVSFIPTTFKQAKCLRQNRIIGRVAKFLASVMLQSTDLQKLHLGHNWLQTETKDSAKSLKKISFFVFDCFNAKEVTVHLEAAISGHNLFTKLCLDLGSSLPPTIDALKRILSLKECDKERINYMFEYLSNATRIKMQRNLMIKDLRLNTNNCSSLNIIPKMLSKVGIYESNNVITKLPYLAADLRGDGELSCKSLASLFMTTSLPYSEKIRNILNPDNLYLQLNADTFYISLQSCITNTISVKECTPLKLKRSLLIVISNKSFLKKDIVTGLDVRCRELNVQWDVFRPFGKQITPDVKPVNQQSITDSMSHQQPFAYQGNYSDAGGTAKADGRQQELLQSSVTTENKHKPLQIQNECYRMPQVSANVQDQSDVQKDGPPSLPHKAYVNVHVSSHLEPDDTERDGKLSMASGIDQASQLSTIPSEHKLMIGNVPSKPLGSADRNRSGGHIVKALPKQTELLPTVGPQLDASYNTNFEHEVQSSHEEVRQKRNARTTFYQHEFEQHAYNPLKIGEINPPKNPPLNDKLQVKVPETGKAANDFKPKPLPKRSCIVCGSKQYPLVNNLISHPHMDHYFVKERTEIRPSHYLAKLVLRHQYLNRYVLYLRMFYFAA